MYSPIPTGPDLLLSSQSATLEWDGQEREFTQYIPPGLPESAPLVMVLHGAGMNGWMMRIVSGYRFDEMADEKKFAVVYPHGLMRHWNDCRIQLSYRTRLNETDDVGFLKALVDWMVEQYSVDPARVYLVGYSNGAHMSFSMAMQAPEYFAGVVTAGASLPEPGNSTCPQDTPTPPLMMMVGTADHWNPIDGGEKIVPGIPKRGPLLSAQESIRQWAVRNGVTTGCPLNTSAVFDSDFPVHRYDCLQDGKPYASLLSVAGAGHVFPQPVYRFPRMYGNTPENFDLPSLALDFFGL